MIKRGKTARGTQRYLCQNALCTTGSFLLDYRNRGCVSEVKQQIIDMSLNASGVRDTARSLHISPTTVLSELKKKEGVLESVNTALLRTLNPEKVAVDIAQAGEAEMDEMWSFGDCSKDTGFIQPVHDEVRRGFVDGLRLGLHATYPRPSGHRSAPASALGRYSFASCDSAGCPAPPHSR